MTGDQTPASTILLQSISAIDDYWKRWPNTVANAILHGLITRVTKRGRIVFFVLTDGSGSIQLVAKKDIFTTDHWNQIKSVKEQSPVQVAGRVGESENRRLSVFLSEPPCEIRALRDKRLSLAWSSVKVVSNQVLLARIRKCCSEFLERQDFMEIEPFYISRSWQGSDLAALEVKYPGFGLPVFLVPSPAAQILKAIVTTGKPKVFCVSRCFTGEFRDIMDRAETVIISAKVHHTSWDHLKELALNGVKSIFSTVSRSPQNEAALSSVWPERVSVWPPIVGQELEAKGVHMEIFEKVPHKNDLFGAGTIDIFRINWPYRANNVCVCDGLLESYADGFAVGTVNWHADRVVHILEDTRSRSLLPLDYSHT